MGPSEGQQSAGKSQLCPERNEAPSERGLQFPGAILRHCRPFKDV